MQKWVEEEFGTDESEFSDDYKHIGLKITAVLLLTIAYFIAERMVS